MNLLLVEDDYTLATGLQRAFLRENFQVTHAADGKFATGAIESYDFDLIILDLGLPDMDGLDLLRALRANKHGLPVLVLTARDGVEQQVAALDAGADDYIEKPFDLRELHARVRALMRRRHAAFGEKIELGRLVLDAFSRSVTADQQVLDLPAREYEILEALMVSAPRVVSKARLAQRLTLKREDIGDNAVEVYVHRLRQRLPQFGIRIRTLRGVGYAIEAA